MTSAREYHAATCYDRHQMEAHHLDGSNIPAVFKSYADRTPIALPEVTDLPRTSLWDVTGSQPASLKSDSVDIRALAQILKLGDSITARTRHGEVYLRTQASAGALYPNEVYVAVSAVDGLDPGLYHYSIAQNALTRLREVDFTRVCLHPDGASEGPAPRMTFWVTGIVFRSAWKYRARALRYILLDAGHLLQNLMAAVAAAGLTASLAYDFDDSAAARFLGIDNQQELALAALQVFSGVPDRSDSAAVPLQQMTPLPQTVTNASRTALQETIYPQITAAYAAGTDSRPADPPAALNEEEVGARFDWTALSRPASRPNALDFAHAALLRRSRRNFISEPLPADAFVQLLWLIGAAAEQLPASPRPPCPLVQIGFLTGSVEGIAPGFYRFDPVRRRIGCIREAPLTAPMAAVCLNQEWLRNASLHFLFLADLAHLNRWAGPRGYRYVMLEAGRLGQAVYLGATALALGACGIGALFDGEAQALLNLRTDAYLLYLVAAGVLPHR